MTSRASDIYRQIKDILKSGSISNSNEARLLFKHILKLDPITNGDKEISESEAQSVIEAAKKRATGYPLQYILGSWDFFDFELEVGEGVLIPRPDTEAVAQKAIQKLLQTNGKLTVDLCSGTGCIAIAIKRAVETSDVLAVEVDPKAFSYLLKNTAKLASEIECFNADALTFYSKLKDNSVDLIVSNPPYISSEQYKQLEKELFFEPSIALVAKNDGYFFYQEITKLYKNKIKNGGYIVFETGDNQSQTVAEILLENGFCDVENFVDCFSNVRGVVAKKSVNICL